MSARLLVIGILFATAACGDKATHENIDKWRTSEQGPGKLAEALANDSLEADLSAHAAANMVRNGRDADVRAALDQMAQSRREAVVGALAPRLWNMARIEGDNAMPSSSTQINAKDALIWVFKYASAPAKQQISQYLIDWYCVPTYDDAKGGGRATLGLTHGDAAMRLVGPAAAKKMMEVGNGVIAAPGQQKAKNKVGDELMTALAATCSPDTVKYVLDLARMDRGDETLQTRAMTALFKAYVDPGGLFDVCDRAPLGPNLDAIVAIAKDDHASGQAADDAVALVSAAGPPACMAPLVSMIAHPHANPSFKYVGAQAALRCGGVAAVDEVAHALPEGPYSMKELQGGVTGEIARLQPRDQAIAAARKLLDDKKVLVRWVGVEALGQLKSTDDVARLASLGGGEKLTGFWGDQSGVDAKDRKPEPTLAQRAKEVAGTLQAPPH